MRCQEMSRQMPTPQEMPERSPARLAWPSLLLGLLILAVMTVFPSIATDATGRADHPAALLLFAAMSAGFVRGVGFIPLHLIARMLLSSSAAFILFLLAILRLQQIGRLDLVF